MSLSGSAAVAIWHDIAGEDKDEFYAWHGKEHMPERVAIPGFLRGRRYRAVDAGLEYFNLYEVRSPQVLTGPDYQQRLDNPTPWTLATVKRFRSVARSLCHVAATLGRGEAGLAATWRYDVPQARAGTHIETLSRTLLPALLEHKTIAGAHLLVADTQASALDSAERKARGEANRVPRWIVIVEAWGDAPAFAELCRRRLDDETLASSGAVGAAEFGVYQLQFSLSGE